MANIRPELLDYLQNLKVEAYKSENTFAMKGPTWLINPKTKLDDYIDDFISDEPGALRDYAAVPTHSLTPFFKDAGVLDRFATVDPKGCPIAQDTLIIAEWFVPVIAFKYFFAGDLSVNGDRTGISMVHFDWFRNKVVLDFSMAINAPQNQRVDYAPIRQLIYNLRARGFNIKKVAFDQFQSNDSINQLIAKGFDAVQVQYADSFVGCTQLHELITQERFEYADWNEILIGEAKELTIVNSKRIDHLQSGGYYNSKDVWDSCVNATYTCLEDYYSNGSDAENNAIVSSVAKKLGDKHKANTDPYDISWIL